MTSNVDNEPNLEKTVIISKHLENTSNKLQVNDSNDEFYITNEYKIDWKDAIFLPFQMIWETMLITTIVMQILLIIYGSFYNRSIENEPIFDVFVYSCHMAYLVDTILSFLHRCMPRYRSVKEYPPKHGLSLLVDLLSLLPIYETYLLVMATSRQTIKYDKARAIFEFRSLLRIYRVYSYFNKLKYTAGVNQVLVSFTYHVLTIVLMTHMAGALWFAMGCYKCPEINWTVYLRLFLFNADNPAHWFVICYTTMGEIAAHNARGLIRSTSLLEAFLIIVVNVLGFVLHYVLFVGRLTEVYTKMFRRRFLFYKNLTSIKVKLHELGIKQEWKKKTLDYYRLYWRKHQGIIRMPTIFHNLPTALQKEVTLDVFWEALRHTHFYRTEDQNFKRDLSLKMKSEFYLSGDYVYTLGKTKSKMVYIASGILQILTEEDEESPILSLSSGTVLGELSCLIPYKSNVYVRCATYCELHTLDFSDLFDVLGNYPGESNLIRTKCLNRISRAQKIKISVSTIAGSKVSEDMGGAIKWIKSQWRHFGKMSDDAKRLKLPQPSLYHTTQFLDLLVLSQKVELKTKEICLRNRCPFIMASNSSFINFLRIAILISVALQCTIVPVCIAFTNGMSQEMFAFSFLIDVMYIVDIYIKLSTIIERGGRVESNIANIIVIQFKKIRFMIDILSSIPLDVVYFMLSGKYHPVFKLNRLLKVYAILDYIKKQEKDMWLSTMTLCFLKFVVIYLISGYWLICLAYAVTCFNLECNYYGWVNYNSVLDKAAGIDNPMKDLPFLESMYYVLFTYYKIGLNNKFAFIMGEKILHYCIVMTGYLVFSFCFAQVFSIYILTMEDRRKYQDRIASMIYFLKRNNFREGLTQSILTMMEFLWYYNRNKDAFGKEGILVDASAELSKQIETERRMQFITKVPLFSGLEKKLLRSLNDHCTVKTLPQEFLVLEKGKRTTGLYIILRGYCKLVSTVPGDEERAAVSILKPGDAFPVVEVLHQAPSQVTVRTSTEVEIISIKYLDIRKILFTNRKIEQEILEGLKEHIKTPKGVLLAGQKRRLPIIIPEDRSLGVGDYFSYKIFDIDTTGTEKGRYLAPFKKLGKFSVIRHILRHSTIDPHSRFFTIWEIFRCIFAYLRVMVALLYANLLTPYQSILSNTLIVFLDLTSILDIYIRLHCQYHNHLGILVTHPCTTALNYLSTSFILDLLGVFPFGFFRIDELLGYHNRRKVSFYLVVVTRPLQLYRLAGAFSYLQADIRRRGALLYCARLFVFLTIIIAAVALVIQLITCHAPIMVDDVPIIVCNNNSWLYTTNMANDISIPLIYLKCVLAAIVTITSTSFGFFSTRFLGDTTIFLILGTVFGVIRWTVIARILSFRVGGNEKLTIYQDQVKTFLQFVETEVIHDELINEVISYYEFMWQSTRGISIMNTLNSLHANLQEEVVYSLYRDALGLVDVLQGADETLLKELGTVIVLRNFKKDSPIIQCNDVQSILYIVNKGAVEITLAGQTISTLEAGGMFGCLKRKGRTRQTITATAVVHVVLLEINSNLFYNIVSVFPEIAQRLKKMNFFNEEYSEPRKQFSKRPTKSSMRPSILTSKAIAHMISTFNKNLFLIKHNDERYRWFEYLMCVHIAPISSIVIMFLTMVITTNPEFTNIRRSVIYASDIIFIIKIFLEFRLTFVSKESGVTVTDVKTIRSRYFRSPWLYASIFMCIPFEIVLLWVTAREAYLSMSFLNRICRAIFLPKYYYGYKDKLNVKIHLRWTYLVYGVFISIQAAAALWWFTACNNGICYFSASYFRHQSTATRPSTNSRHAIMMSYLYVVNLLTGTGWRNVGPTSLLETAVTTFLICSFQLALVVLITVFTTILSIEGHSFNQYEYNILQLRTYLEGRQLSKPILDKVWIYSLQLWKRHRGECIPSIILEMPSYLNQRIMVELYGHHLGNHFLFQNTHVDFLRQVATYLISCVFFPENYIVESGDKDGCMYFIHEGEVEVRCKAGNTEMIYSILKKGESFGEAQGLYNIRYKFSYKARTVVKVLILKHSDWKFLLNWFPASKEMMDIQAAEHRIFQNSADGGQI